MDDNYFYSKKLALVAWYPLAFCLCFGLFNSILTLVSSDSSSPTSAGNVLNILFSVGGVFVVLPSLFSTFRSKIKEQDIRIEKLEAKLMEMSNKEAEPDGSAWNVIF